ncbi:hypothetical protein B0H19DRAFT_1249252 [Mycena capillaripes]|nr:hypothetical protein B0H19DRAFT_1249252 [Mycena capillaripes]
MLDTVPSGVKLTEVIEPLPVKPKNIVLRPDGDKLKLSGSVRLWGLAEDSTRHVHLLWDDHLGHMRNASLDAAFVATSYISYAFNQTAGGLRASLLLSPAAGITTMRFLVNGKLEDQGGVGFAVQNGMMFSTSSCLTPENPLKGRFDIAVRNGFNPTRVYLEQEMLDEVNRTVVVETDITPPATPVPAGNNAYSLCSIHTDNTKTFTIGAEVNGVKYSTPDGHPLDQLSPC